MAYDVRKAIATLRRNAPIGQSSLHRCAAYVVKALVAGGLPFESGDGWAVGGNYEKHGYRRVNVKINGKKIIGAAVGDICSIACNVRHRLFPNYNRGGEIHPGHACMYDGEQWISDYRQGQNAVPYGRGVKWVHVYRWKDLPGDINIPPDDNSYSSSATGGGGDSSGGGVTRYVYKEQYPVHSEYVTYTGRGGNIFEKSEMNSVTFTQAQYSSDSKIDKIDKTKSRNIRIYSTNDSCIVLDSLTIPVDDATETYANKGITAADVEVRNAKLKEEEEKAKKEKEKKDEENKNKEEKEKKEQEEKEKKDKK